ncbi:hypothetical protein GQ43DRAFT_54313 [Delitschia confertaspora ATCC 74209]|uniref:C4-dicarboxylate transporter/malic acid transport protein n=1 Tax=Delitschia confertaspora ATCC 74209 TaxID=1513339 RepID=A0A9P4JKA8_9PLEO|nr:hypothetical protein GQ43DRAFT_54313 [Delitschia confertaspora ATCC 74209]
MDDGTRAPSETGSSLDRGSISLSSTNSHESASKYRKCHDESLGATPKSTPDREQHNPFEDLCYKADGEEAKRNGQTINRAHGGVPGGAGIWPDRREVQELEDEVALGLEEKLGWSERIRHFTWTWFTMTMATGGLANVMYTVPFRFHGLYAIGCIFFILNVVLFILVCGMISWRFYLYPKTFTGSFKHPTESLFIPAAVIGFGTILINITQYGVGNAGGWLEEGMWVLYWIYCGLAIVFSLGIYLIMWSTQTFTVSQMTPVWIFPAYPLLIVGPHAGNLAAKLAPERAIDVIISGYIIQGIGFLVSLMIYSAYIYRLMTHKLPNESLRPGMFISVGPSGFTIAGIITMGSNLPKVVPRDFMGEGNGEFAARVSQVMANWMGLWLWGLALWFFFVSVGAHWSCATKGRLDFAMTWYSFVFPNTALTTATFAIASALGNNRPIQYVGCVMTVALVVTWFFVFGMMIRAVWLKQILWPQKQEDRSEGGWKQPKIEDDKQSIWVRSGQSVQGDEESGLNRFWSLRRTLTSKDRLGESRIRSNRTWTGPADEESRMGRGRTVTGTAVASHSQDEGPRRWSSRRNGSQRR